MSTSPTTTTATVSAQPIVHRLRRTMAVGILASGLMFGLASTGPAGASSAAERATSTVMVKAQQAKAAGRCHGRPWRLPIPCAW